MLRLAEKAFYPARIPFPVMHVDTGHNFPEVLAFRDKRVDELGVQLIVASVQEAIDDGTRGRAAGRHPQPDPDAGPARRAREAPLHRDLRRRPPRRGEGPRQGAGLLLPRRVRPVGPEEPAPRAVEPLQRPDPRGREHPGLPAVELDRARHLALHRARGASSSPRSTSPTSARSSSATGCSTPSTSSCQPKAGEDGRRRRRSATAPSATRA